MYFWIGFLFSIIFLFLSYKNKWVEFPILPTFIACIVLWPIWLWILIETIKEQKNKKNEV